MFVYCAIAIAAYLFYKWATQNNDYFEKRGIPFSKPTFLLGGNSNMFFNKMSLPEVSQKWYNELRHEKISGLFEFRRPLYFIRDPKLVKKMAVKDFDHFVDHRVIFDESMDKLFGKALISLQGQKWRDMRATLSPMFTGSKMRQMFDYVARVGKQTALTMKDQIKSGSDNEFEFKALTTKFTVDVIASCAFGIECNSFENSDNEFQKIAMNVTNFTNLKTTLKFAGYLLFPPVMKAFNIKFFGTDVENFFHEAVHETMKIREEKGIVRHDMLNLLMQVKKGSLKHDAKEEEKVTDGFATVEESQMGKSSQVKTVFDDDDLAAQAFIFFFAGFDTVATTMSFMGHELAVNADVQQKLYDEILEMNEQLDGKTIGYDQIQGMKYMDQVVCETLRKWPAAPITDRTCVKDYETEYDGKKFSIEKGKSIIIPIYPIHHDPLYYPEPLKFDPERFSDENKSNIDPDTYMPFGVGPRNCIGSRFALMEMKTIFYYLLLNFSIEVTKKTQIPLQFAKNPIGLKTEEGIWIALKPRD